MSVFRALAGGMVGAATLTLVHQLARALTDDAPRMDVLGMNALMLAARELDLEPPDHDTLYVATLIGDIISNTAYYGLAALGTEGGEVERGVLLGLAAGVGGIVLPPLVGLSSEPSRRTAATAVMTVAWYTLGGAAAGMCMRLLRR